MLRDRLSRYWKKRDFNKTAEPSGKKGAKKGRELRYLIQKHDASRLHYDFRLEHDGVLLSWACPKGPSHNPDDKRLAVHVEDHPIDYGDFEGTIPKGQYGGGTVMLWDRGTWEPHQDDVEAALKKGKLSFTLHGERLEGNWALVRLRGRPGDKRDNWLLIKENDEFVRKKGKLITETELTSISTGRSMEEIAQGSDVWQSNRAEKKTKAGKTKAGNKKKSKAQTGAKPAKKGAGKIPAFTPPQLATLVDAAPAGKEWLHEIKYDGYRALASIGGDNVVIRTRNGLDWTDKFAALVEPLRELPCQSALLDGEIAVADTQGHTDFGALQDALSRGTGGYAYYVFDLLQLDGEDLRNKPLRERKKLLAQLMNGGPPSLIYSDHVEGAGADVFQNACDLKLEGIISKRAGDPYRGGRTKSWLKVKCGMEQEFVIVGWQPSDKAGRPFRSILLAVREEGELRYAGRVGSGFNELRLDELSDKFDRAARKSAPVEVPRAIARRAKWIEPTYVAEIAFRGWTKDGLVRQGSFKGLRGDKSAGSVVRERPMATKKATNQAKGLKQARAGSSKEEDVIGGVRVTHPDRVVFPDQGVTKRAIADYYLLVAHRMLPHIANRPLALVRCPQGSGKECFFQKHANPGWPDLFRKVRIKEKVGSADYLYIDNKEGLIAAAQMGVLELHLWGSHEPDVEKPDRMVFDLDPDEGLNFGDVKKAAIDVKKRLEKLGLKSLPMVTGGKGIHIVVPLKPGHSWDEHREFAEAIARLMADEEPDRFVANMSKAKRKGKIFVDYLRNQRGSTAIAPYSTRARKGAYVAWPVTWAQLGKLKDARPVSVENAAQKIKGADPWASYGKIRQKLPKLR